MSYLHGNEVHIATIRGDLKMLESLIRHQSLNLPGLYFHSALHAAVEIGRLDTVKWILEHGAEVNDARGNPLQIAVERGHTEIVSLLLNAGADPTLSTGEYGSTLHTAVFLQRLDIVRLLVREKTTLFHRQSAFGSVLDVAACRKDGNSRMLTALVSAGVNINTEDSGCSSSLDAAVICGYRRNVGTLLRLGARGDQGLKLAIQRKLLRIARLILDHQPRTLETITSLQWSPLISAAANDDFKMVLLILQRVQASFRPFLLEMTGTWQGLTPLDCARRAGQVKITQLLEVTLVYRHAPAITYRSKRHRGSELIPSS